MQCSVQIDSIGRDSLAKDLEPFKYKENIEIPALGMVDDILTITKCSVTEVAINATVNAFIKTRN